MRKEYRHIALWLSSMLMLLCTACGGSESESDDNNPSKEHQLQINIFTPEHPVVTRAGDPVLVNSNADENVNSMDVWVFVSEAKATEHFPAGKVVGHLSLDITDPSSFVGGTYQMSVNEDFVKELPKVNVYVTANVKPSNTGITLTASSPEEAFTSAKLSGDYFGLNTMTTEPPSEGLPMSGLLKNQTIDATRTPLLSVATPVKVVRAVSKVRFIFSRTNTGDELHINSISLDNSTATTTGNSGIPVEEYLFLSGPYDDSETPRYRIGGDFLGVKTLADGLGSIPIPTSTYPARYAFDPNNTSQLKGQEYENLIDEGLHGHYSEGTYTEGSPELVELRHYYLRESNKRLQGKINYTIGSKTADATFVMYEGDNFTRNHTWIVYGYFAGKETLKVSCVSVIDWDQTTTDHSLYNW